MSEEITPICSISLCFNSLKHPIEITEGRCLSCIENGVLKTNVSKIRSD